MSNYKDLHVLGLSKLAAACYETLYKDGSATAGEIACRLNRPKSSIYYVLESLEKQGFVEPGDKALWPEVTYFRAVRLDKALEDLAIYQRHAVHSITEEQIERSIKILGASQKTSGRDWR